ncbi:MAG: 4'-phosphopantetheinyl transferase superfamily protein [Bryobacterales bacterium]|nr:4'-phosphopantetheinyl transferase superfamily protein [Bryobacterales bacterium]
MERLWDVLDQEERRRASRFRFETLRAKYILAHGFLRELLGCYLHMDARKITFTFNAYGKPGVACGGLQFNLSHSGSLAAVAISMEAPVGIDIEEIRPLPDLCGLTQRFFAASEQNAVHAFPPHQRETAFFTYWTRKEALVKGLGQGFSISLESFDTSLVHGGQGLLSWNPAEASEAITWWLSDLPAMEGYAGAIAIKGCTPKLSSWCCVLD